MAKLARLFDVILLVSAMPCGLFVPKLLQSRDGADLPSDLDTIASSVAYAFLSSTLEAGRTAPVLLTPKNLMKLRPENLLALKQAGIPQETLIHSDDLPQGTEGLIPAGVKMVLVDHNRLLAEFGGESDYDKVAAIIDHHQDEGYSLKANPRIIEPVGSSSSLVTKHFMPAWKASLSGPSGQAGSPVPPEIATLLLSAIIIDTQCLKRGGKAVQVDHESAQFLYPLSTLTDNATDLISTPQEAAWDTKAPPPLEAFASELISTKFNVDGMSELDLLQRDYKQYVMAAGAADAFSSLDVGLSTVPVALKKQLQMEDGGWETYMSAIDDFMNAHKLDIEGVLTTFKNDKGNSRREILLTVRVGVNIPDIMTARSVLSFISDGLQGETDMFSLSPWGADSKGAKAKLAAEGEKLANTTTRLTVVWDQGNHKSTRKQVAPALVSNTSRM